MAFRRNLLLPSSGLNPTIFRALTSCSLVEVNAPNLVYFFTERGILSDVQSVPLPESPFPRLY
jgi:hypothetical protein